MSTDKGVRVWLRRHGAEQIAHPGGNLYAHLCRVSERLAVLGCSSEVQAAGLTHAVIEHDPAVADRHGTYFRELFASCAPPASEQVIRDAQRVSQP
jgi:(p)ppGpp synthase/HD superfamily hydrolase